MRNVLGGRQQLHPDSRLSMSESLLETKRGYRKQKVATVQATTLKATTDFIIVAKEGTLDDPAIREVFRHRKMLCCYAVVLVHAPRLQVDSDRLLDEEGLHGILDCNFLIETHGDVV